MNIDTETQLERWRRAIELLGGTRAAARIFDCSDRTLRMIAAGERDLHAGWLEDMARALVDHADQCRKIERLLMPGFRSNLTAEQAEAKPHHMQHRPKQKDAD